MKIEGIISFDGVVKIAKMFQKKNYDDIPDNWEELINHYIAVKEMNTGKLNKFEQTKSASQLLFARFLLKDPEHIGNLFTIEEIEGKHFEAIKEGIVK